MHQFPVYTDKTNTDSFCFTYQSIMESNLIEYVESDTKYVEWSGVNVNKVGAHLFIFSNQTSYLSDKCRNVIMISGTVAEYSIVEIFSYNGNEICL